MNIVAVRVNYPKRQMFAVPGAIAYNAAAVCGTEGSVTGVILPVITKKTTLKEKPLTFTR